MKRYLSYLLIFVLTLTTFGCSKIAEDINTQKEQVNQIDSNFKRVDVELAKQIDGDTIAVIYNGKQENVRFLLVDSPETSHPRLGEQPYGKEAKDFTSSLVENAHKIELEFDIGANKDKYGRLLAYVYVDGKMIQEELLKKGLARVAYVYPPNTRYVDQFRALQEVAQQKDIGIWEIENYSQDDGFHPDVLEDANKSSKNNDINFTIGANVPEVNCEIKGNINSKGEKIYHTTDSHWYAQTKAEVWFCTVEEATQAGFRSSEN